MFSQSIYEAKKCCNYEAQNPFHISDRISSHLPLARQTQQDAIYKQLGSG